MSPPASCRRRRIRLLAARRNLAAVAERAGHEVELQSVADGGPTLDLRRFDVVAFSISSSATYGVLLQARESALIRPEALLLAGGVHANFYPERTLRDFKVHAVGVGEGEITFLECLARRREPHRLARPSSSPIAHGGWDAPEPGQVYVGRARVHGGRAAKNHSVKRDYIVDEPLHGTHVVIFDDVYDTGGSLRSMAQAALRAGAKSCSGLVIAQRMPAP